ncbi:uncharacterized protein LOC143635574 isoform X2 [Bidens hawaiensis]|uniref:uncharacterized protein LOC143635574 isoform X2 n=1 Tax=Bidens hawaiensis TaxID=980011 RepID=UPI00404AF64B
MLLGYQRGCRSYSCIRTVDGQIYPTFRAACEKLGLLGDDKEWSCMIEEASNWATASELRTLFSQMLLYCEISDPLQLWNQHWRKMTDDIRQNYGVANEDDLKEYVLYELELLLHSSPTAKSLANYGLPMPNANMLQRLQNKSLMDERNYDRQLLASEHISSLGRLNPQQRLIYEHVMSATSSNQQVLAFVYGHGGTGKTFLWTTIIAALRSTGNIVLAVAASGIASLLLPSGRTAHSRFKIPLDMTDDSTCDIKKNTQLAHLVNETSLIIWDEAPMNERKCFESLDRSLKDLFNNSGQPFGGKFVILGGDFRQTLPIISRSSKTTILAASLPRSYLWRHFKATESKMYSKPLSEIKARQSPQLITIRVLKKWISRGKRPELRYLFVECNVSKKKYFIAFIYTNHQSILTNNHLNFMQADAIEVIADLQDEQHFESIIKIQSCYNISNYISISSRKYMSITPHEASIIIGKKTRIVPTSNDNIPTTYFNFARYEELQGRLGSWNLLTDYIGRVVSNKLSDTKTNITLRKIRITDISGNPIVITLWPDKINLIDDTTVASDILAITATRVTEYDGNYAVKIDFAIPVF